MQQDVYEYVYLNEGDVSIDWKSLHINDDANARAARVKDYKTAARCIMEALAHLVEILAVLRPCCNV